MSLHGWGTFSRWCLRLLILFCTASARTGSVAGIISACSGCWSIVVARTSSSLKSLLSLSGSCLCFGIAAIAGCGNGYGDAKWKELVKCQVEWNDAASSLSKTAFLSRTYTFLYFPSPSHNFSSARPRLLESCIRLEIRIERYTLPGARDIGRTCWPGRKRWHLPRTRTTKSVHSR